MKLIPLTRGKFAMVDDADFDWLSTMSWQAAPYKGGRTWTAHRMGPRDANGKRYRMIMSRVLLGLEPGDKRIADHVDFNGLNNQRTNLRAITSSRNAHHRRGDRISSSRFKGVCWDAQMRKWRVTMRVAGKTVLLCLFEDEEAAARAFDEAARKHHGEFAVLNFPESKP